MNVILKNGLYLRCKSSTPWESNRIVYHLMNPWLFSRFPLRKEGDVSDQRYEEGPYQSRNERFGNNKRKKGGDEIPNGANQTQDRDDDKSLDDAEGEDDTCLE